MIAFAIFGVALVGLAYWLSRPVKVSPPSYDGNDPKNFPKWEPYRPASK